MKVQIGDSDQICLGTKNKTKHLGLNIDQNKDKIKKIVYTCKNYKNKYNKSINFYKLDFYNKKGKNIGNIKNMTNYHLRMKILFGRYK